MGVTVNATGGRLVHAFMQILMLGRDRLKAFAVVAQPAILILDEATANLDFRTELSLKSALSVLVEGRTALIIAHRRSMLTDVDRVLVLQNGRIEQDGTPDQLMKVDGYFRDMMFRADGPLTESA